MKPHLGQELLDALALGIANPRHLLSANAHLAECEICRAALEARMEIARAIAAPEQAGPPQISDEAWSRNARRAMQRGMRTPAYGSRRATGFRIDMKWRYAAMALLFFAGYGLRAIQYSPPQPVWEPLREANLSRPIHALPQPEPPSRAGTAYRLALTTTTMRIDDARM